MKLIPAIGLLFCTVLFAQPESTRWTKAEVTYELPAPGARIYRINSSSVGSTLETGFIFTYKFFISDLDGDNCPFHPTCSRFFIQSVRETNFLKGSLMFGDRFMRDTNFLKRKGYYPQHISGKFYDPVHNYKLNKSEIIYYPREIIVE
jgi:putative component of membrane protein insertase Oxa1/YidC/SpoIIIJ protein YidD